MKGLKNTIISLLVLGLFIGGMLFMYFLSSNNSSTQSGMKIFQTLLTKQTFPYTHFTSTIRLNTLEHLSTKPTLTDREKEQVEQIIKNILDIARNDKLCQKGNLNLAPTFDYKDGQKVQKGHQVSGAIQCEIQEKDLQKYNALLKDLQTITSKSDWTSLWTSALYPIITDEEYAEATQTSRDEILQRTKDLKSYYEKSLKQVCAITSIAFQENTPNILAKSSKLTNTGADALNSQENFTLAGEIPLDREAEVSISADLVLECY